MLEGKTPAWVSEGGAWGKKANFRAWTCGMNKMGGFIEGKKMKRGESPRSESTREFGARNNMVVNLSGRRCQEKTWRGARIERRSGHGKLKKKELVDFSSLGVVALRYCVSFWYNGDIRADNLITDGRTNGRSEANRG